MNINPGTKQIAARIAQRLDRGGDAVPVLGVVFDCPLLLSLGILRYRAHVAGRQVKEPLVLLMPALQGVAQLADSRPGALAQLDVERDRSDICTAIPWTSA